MTQGGRMTGARHVSSLPSLPSSYHLIENTFTNTDEGWRQAFSILHIHFHVSMSIVHKPYQCNLHDTPPHMILLKKKKHSQSLSNTRKGWSKQLFPSPVSISMFISMPIYVHFQKPCQCHFHAHDTLVNFNIQYNDNGSIW